MGILNSSPLSAILDKLRGKKEEQGQSVVTPSNTTSTVDESTRFNPDTYQYENEVDDIEREMYYEDEIQYEEGAEYDSDDYGLDANEDVYYDYYDPSTDDDDTYSAAD